MGVAAEMLEDDERGHERLDLVRRITVDGRMFRLDVHYRTGTRIAIGFTAEDELGEGRASLLHGEIEISDLVPARNALVTLLGGIAVMVGEARAGPAIDLAALRRQYPNAWQSWTSAEEARLVERRRAGLSIDELAHEFGRRPGGIRARLEKLGMPATDSPESPGQIPQ